MAPTSMVYFLHYGISLVITVISTVILRFLIKVCTKPSSSFRPPPSPLALPIIGHLHLLGSSLPKSFQTLACRYGPLMQIRIGLSPFIVVSNATIAKGILKTQDVSFTSRFEIGPNQYNIYKGCAFTSGPYGVYWRFMKKLCITKLFTGPQLERFNYIRQQEMENLLRSLKKTTQVQPRQTCNLTTELANLTNNIIYRMTMSKRFLKNPEELVEMRKVIRELMESAAKFRVNEVHGFMKKIDLFGKGRKVTEVMRKYDRLMEKIMKDYEENLMNYGEKDLLDILLETYADVDAEVKISRNQIKYFLLELFLASIDTLSAAIQWAMAELINHPQVFKKLRTEIDSIVKSKRLIKESDVPNLPFLQAVVKETLRLRTPAHLIHRQCTKDCQINGFDIKVNDKVLINAYAIMRDPDAWTDPDKFLPERFLVGETEEIKGQDFRYLPFGGGRRGCAGMTHAYLVIHGVVGALVQCFDWKLKEGENKVEINVASGYAGAVADYLDCYPILRFDPF